MLIHISDSKDRQKTEKYGRWL